MMPDKFMVFDVESVGLHGEAFAVAWVVVNRRGQRLGEGCLACDPDLCSGAAENHLWVSENVPPLEVTSPTKMHLRNSFWHEWRRWADQGAVLVADCAWPVEANFLSECVRQNHAEREWQGPYPLHDLASMLLAQGEDPLATTKRLPDELPRHHPLMDARQSARQLVECLQRHNDPHRMDFIEKKIRESYTGVSFDWVPSVEGDPSGYRMMWRHTINDQRPTLRGAIDEARHSRDGKHDA